MKHDKAMQVCRCSSGGTSAHPRYTEYSALNNAKTIYWTDKKAEIETSSRKPDLKDLCIGF